MSIKSKIEKDQQHSRRTTRVKDEEIPRNYCLSNAICASTRDTSSMVSLAVPCETDERGMWDPGPLGPGVDPGGPIIDRVERGVGSLRG